MRLWLVLTVLIAAALVVGPRASQATHGLAARNPCANARPIPGALRLPAQVPQGDPAAIEKTMLAYLSSYAYRDLGWCVDKGVRDTGPYVGHRMYGTHPAVRIYYSPEVMAWLRAGRHGAPRDGAVIIKEQYGTANPAAYYAGRGNADLRPLDWTVMIRRSSASRDGWFWSEVYVGMFGTPASPLPIARTQYPNSGFGLYCLRCHSSAKVALTFASLENIRGYPGEPIQYYVDDSWRWPTPPPALQAEEAAAGRSPTPVPLAVQTFPAEPLDTYLAHPHSATQFVTSDQCMGCHSGSAQAPAGPLMWVTPAPQAAASGAGGINVSEYGEWRWSPMGLAGRDPVFYAQLESELAYDRTIPNRRVGAALHQQTIDTCMTCHGVMGKRTYAKDHPGAAFSPAFVFDAQPSHQSFHYGGLARDGISCTVCHHVVPAKTPPGEKPLAYFLANKINGRFDLSAPDKLDGPYKNDVVVTHPMNEALGAKPVFSSYMASSRMCGSCHTINLPVVDVPPIRIAAREHNVEQATYVEWINSRFQTEYSPGAGAKSCQDCHMPAGITDPARGVDLAHIASKIALVEDTSYPQTTGAASQADLDVRFRKTGYHRHELLGLNAFLLTTFAQFPDVMGVRKDDYMSSSSTDLQDAIANVVRQARRATATLAVRAHAEAQTLVADVEVTNLTGHRFPSGVAFRRAFLDVEAREGSGSDAKTFFASGRTDAQGRIVGADGTPLPSESFARDANGDQQYQEHYDQAHPVTSPNQAEIFEELTRDHAGNFTTSFLRRDHEVKDNRLLPAGWTATGPRHALPPYFLAATFPKGRAAADPVYRDGKGRAIVRYRIPLPPSVEPGRVRVSATLYYQSWAPYFLAERNGGGGNAAVRLRALTGRLALGGTDLAGWKLRIASNETPAGSGRI